MNWIFKTRETALIVFLLALTIATYLIGHGNDSFSRLTIHTLIVLTAVIKVRFIIFGFQHVSGAPLFLRLICDGWLICVTVALLWLSAQL